MINDPKWRTIARVSGQKIGDVVATYVHMLTCASAATDRGHIHGWCDEDVATALDINVEQVEAIREAMQGRVLDGDYLAGWEKRQPKREREDDDNAAERKRQQREREANLKQVTQGHAMSRHVTPREEKIREEENHSVPTGTGADAPHPGEPENPKTPEQLTKDEIWRSGRSLLLEAGLPKDQCGTYLGKLVKDYGVDIVVDAVRTAIVERSPDPKSFLKSCCMARKQEGGKSLIPWHATDAGVQAKGEELNPPLKPYPGETNFTFKARVIAAIESAGKPVPPRPPPVDAAAGEPVRMSESAVELGRAAIRAAAKVRPKVV